MSENLSFESGSKPTWKLGTRVGTIMSALRASTNLDALASLANVTAEEKERHRRLSEDLSKEPLKASAEQILFADQLRQLAAGLQRVATENDDERLQAIKVSANDARTKRAAATLAANLAFGASAIDGVGGQVWRTLWDAARHYSEHFAYVGRPSPTDVDAVCVLCQQPLTSGALARFGEFDAFIQADTERQAKDAEGLFLGTRKLFEKNRVNAPPFAGIRQRLALSDPALGHATLRCLASARQRHIVCERSLGEDAALVLPAWAENPIEKIRELESATRKYAEELRQAADVEGRRRLEVERDELTDRLALDVLQLRAKVEVGRLKGLQLVASCLGDTSTAAITSMETVELTRLRGQWRFLAKPRFSRQETLR
jgi:hypothetical protein